MPNTITSRLLVLGATGGLGHQLVEQALARGHAVTAFVRSPLAVKSQGARLLVVEGDPRDDDALSKVAAGHDVIVSALGPRARHDERLMPDCARSMTVAARRAGVPRMLLVSAGLLFPGLGLPGAVFRWLMRGAMRGAVEAETIVMKSEVEWTIVRPVRLTSGPLTRAYRVGSGRLPLKPQPIGRADVADFLLEEIRNAGHLHSIVGLCG